MRGKTTLLDAVRLCLYGKRALGNRVSHSEYYNYLSEMIHRSPTANSPIDSASVSLEFEYARDGEKKRYTVERSWKRQRGGKTVKETLTIYENNRLNAEVEADHWQDYINELIPIWCFPVFLF